MRYSITFLRIHFFLQLLLNRTSWILILNENGFHIFRKKYFAIHKANFEHKFKHGFQDSLDLSYRCGSDIESFLHFFLHCPLLQNERLVVLSTAKNIDSKLLNYSDLHSTQILLFDDTSLDINSNSSVFNAAIDFVIPLFKEPLF